jgi:hypothetical protein
MTDVGTIVGDTSVVSAINSVGPIAQYGGSMDIFAPRRKRRAAR